jgi:GntR family transcriptional regulator/MocR family aminotransferase
MLRENLSDVIDFKTPEGGLAIWAKFEKRISLPVLSDKLRAKRIILSNGLVNNTSENQNLNATRMGFGWMNMREAERAVYILCDAVREL